VVLGGQRNLKPEGLKIEAEGRGRGGVLGEGRLAPPHQLGSGERCKLHSGAEIEFWHSLA